MYLQWVGTILAIVLVDLSLSGDNAVVIGAVASRLPPRRQRLAIGFGILMAIVARIALGVTAVLVLKLPYVQAVGGLIVLLIALQMAYAQATGAVDKEAERAEHPMKRRSWRTLSGDEGLLRAAAIIVLADVSMSLDNILAIVALARGNDLLLAAGFLLSMLMLLVASSIIARFIARFPLLMYGAAGILAWTAGVMLLEDHSLHPYITQLDAQVPGPPLVNLVAPVSVVLVVLFSLAAWLLQRLRHRKIA